MSPFRDYNSLRIICPFLTDVRLQQWAWESVFNPTVSTTKPRINRHTHFLPFNREEKKRKGLNCSLFFRLPPSVTTVAKDTDGYLDRTFFHCSRTEQSPEDVGVHSRTISLFDFPGLFIQRQRDPTCSIPAANQPLVDENWICESYIVGTSPTSCNGIMDRSRNTSDLRRNFPSTQQRRPSTSPVSVECAAAR